MRMFSTRRAERSTAANVIRGAAAALLIAGPIEAQQDSLRLEPSLGAIVGTPISSFGKRVDNALGIDAMLRVARDDKPMSWRLGVSVLVYGWDTETTCVSTGLDCRLRIGVTTTNQIWSVETGPERRGTIGPLEWRGHLSAGASVIHTLTGMTSDYEIFPTHNQEESADGGFVWGGGVGLSYALGSGTALRPTLDVEASYRQHGIRSYLVEGGISSTTGGIVRDMQRSNVSLLQWRVGVTLRPQLAGGKR
jgi:hypothetical protein